MKYLKNINFETSKLENKVNEDIVDYIHDIFIDLIDYLPTNHIRILPLDKVRHFRNFKLSTNELSHLVYVSIDISDYHIISNDDLPSIIKKIDDKKVFFSKLNSILKNIDNLDRYTMDTTDGSIVLNLYINKL